MAGRRPEPRHRRQPQRARRSAAMRGLPDHPTGMPYDALEARTSSMRLDGTLPKAAASRRPSGVSTVTSTLPARRRRHPACALAVRHQSRLPAPRHPAFPLHDRALWRRQPALRRLRDFRHAGAVRRRAAGDGRSTRLPAGQPRHAGARRRPAAGARSRRRTRSLCEQYWRACQLGQPVLLDAAEMATVLASSPATGSRPERRRRAFWTKAESVMLRISEIRLPSTIRRQRCRRGGCNRLGVPLPEIG
jgi:hypothetical protein